MKSTVTLILIALVAILAGCGTGQEIPLTDFDKVELRSGFHVDISVGEEYSVVLKVNEDFLDDVEAVKVGDTLIIRAKPGHNLRGASLKAEVVMPALTGLALNSGSWVTVRGSGSDVTISLKGGSHAELGNFTVENANLSATSGSHVTVNVSGRLDVDVSGGSHVKYIGEPQIGDVGISGGSTFTNR
ncbi:GIN domain-containing protein [Chloroflexota bacterium]